MLETALNDTPRILPRERMPVTPSLPDALSTPATQAHRRGWCEASECAMSASRR